MLFLLTLEVTRVTNIKFLPTTSADQQEKGLWELLNWLPKVERFDLKPNSLNYSYKKCMEISLENLYVDRAAWRVKYKEIEGKVK